MTDAPVQAAKTYYYAITAVDTAGNESAPTVPAAVRPFRAGPPDPLSALAAAWDTLGITPVVRLTWTLPERLEVLVQRRRAGTAIWSSLGGWLAEGATSFDDATADPTVTYEYQVKGRDNGGRQSEPSAPVTVVAID